MIAGCGEEALVGGDAEAVYLGVWMLDSAGADARESFPEPNCVVIPSCTKCQSLKKAKYIPTALLISIPVQRITLMVACGAQIASEFY